MPEPTLADRLGTVLDTLGIRRAHFAAQMASDIAGFVVQHPDRAGGISLVAPPRMEPEPFRAAGARVQYIAPTGGMLGKTAALAIPRLPDAHVDTLAGYDAESWSDLAADRPDVADLMSHHFASVPGVDVRSGGEISGEIAGIRYRALGGGPVLVLTPLAFAPSQWGPVLAVLARRFRVVVLEGRYLGMLALLEQRAELADWQQMCAGLFEGLALTPGGAVLEAGCGSGAVARQFVRHTGGRNPLTAIDLSAYLLNEARRSADVAGVSGSVTFQNASAENLPFDDDLFEAAYAVTVLEECDARRAIDEMMRVVRPGGRVGIIVRATDLAQWWNLALPADLRGRIAMPAASVSPGGVATADLYRLAVGAGLRPLRLYPYSVASEAISGPVLEFPEMHALSLLGPREQAIYQAAKADAIAEGTLFMTRGHHCFIGEVSG